METKQNKFLEFVVNVVFGLSLVGFFVAFNFSDKMNGWHQQFLPAGGGKPIAGMVFVDSLTGFIVTGADTVGNTNYILKTTDGGENWTVNETVTDKFYKLQFLNDSTGLAIANNKLFKTFNKGLNWSYITMPIYPVDMYAVNKDTIFGVDAQPIIGGFWRTTNGGTSWQKLVNFGSLNPSGVYFYNKNIGYINRGGGTWKTTDGGFNWFQISGNYGDMYYIDSLLGYKTTGYISKTTDGGLSWVNQQQPNIFYSGFEKLTIINEDTIFGVGGVILNNGYNGVIYKTTNGGINWGYQQPLTNNSISVYKSISFSNKLNGGAFKINVTGVHTNVGGNDTTIFTGINSSITNVPKDYVLYQNYPNPFNQSSIIKYQLSIAGTISIKVFDIQGKEIMTLVNERKPAGMYEIKFNGSSLSSGIYFYTLFSDGNRIETRKMTLLK